MPNKKLTEEIRTIKNIKVYYTKIIVELSLEKFSTFILGI